VTDISRTRSTHAAKLAFSVAAPSENSGNPLWDVPPFPTPFEVYTDEPIGFAEPEVESRSDALMELIATPAAICDRAANVLHSNSLMETIFRAQDGLFVQGGMLKCTAGIQSTLLLNAIQDLTKSRFLRVSRAGNADPFIVVLSPLNAAEVLIRIVTTVHRRVLDGNSLCEIFDLTRSEALLCVALARCGSLKEAAAECGITTGSARQYMKRIFTKTNTSSQVALLSLLLHYPIL